MDDLHKMIAWRLATGAIDAAEYDRQLSRIDGRALNSDLQEFTGVEHQIRLYSLYRDYVKHEDDLINQRLTWNFTIQGLLFAAYAFAFQKTAELWKALSDGVPLAMDSTASAEKVAAIKAGLAHVLYSLKDISFFLVALAGAGLVVSIIVLMSTVAANTAIKTLEDRWHDLNPAYAMAGGKRDTHGPTPPGLPGLIGGGNHAAAHSLTFQAAHFLPAVFILTWMFLSWRVLIDLTRISGVKGL